MFNHVLVPLDGSELSEKALATARQVLAPEGTLILLSVIDLPNMNLVRLYDMPLTTEHQDHEDEIITARKNVQAYLRRIAATQHVPATATITLKVCIGSPASIIPELSRALHADVIVMSTHGRSGFSRWMFGSVTQRVLEAMPCPVIVVPGQLPVPVEPEAAHATLSPSS